MQKGTTPSWMRPFHVEVEIEEGFNDINVIELLVTTGMAQSKAEAKRLIEQNLIWLDNEAVFEYPHGVPESFFKGVEGTTIWDRLRKVALELNKFLLVERDDIICVGKTLDDAVCHRIVFIEKRKEL